MKTMSELLQLFPNNQTILDSVVKTEDHIASGGKIMVSISGGSDSDIVLDLFERIGYEPGQVVYVWFDTGLEYEATKRHLVFLEQKYGIEIQRHKAKVPIPVAVKRYGVPFISKEVSEKFERLQKKGFRWEDEPYEDLAHRYDHAKAGLKWWCKGKRETSFTIERLAGLKEFVMANHPPRISGRCCNGAKKAVGQQIAKQIGADMQVVGVRRAEGGIRATKYTSCFTGASAGHTAQFRPIFYWSDADKAEYEDFCGVVHSDCYTVYGMKRTGCAGCPFNSRWEEELEIVKRHEPKLYQAANAIFGESYEYTRKYRKFKESFKREKRRGGQIDLFDRWDEM